MFKTRMFGLFLAVILLAGCGTRTITGSGDVMTQEETITDFNQVDVSHSFEVDISQDDTFRVVVRIDDNLARYLQVVKLGDTLQIGFKSNTPVIRNATLQAEISMPKLAGLDMSGSSHVTITGFTSAQAFVADLSGSSDLRGEIEAGDATFDLSGSSEVILTGSAQNVIIEASGSSEIDLTDFPVVDANLNLSSSSEATVNASGRLDVDASSASHVYYLGSPTLGKMDTSGAASIEKK